MTFDVTDFPPAYVNQWNVPCEDASMLGACGVDARMHRRLLLDAHIHRLWMALPDQSRKRLSMLAASAGLPVAVDDHLELVGALEMIAEAEGTLEVERDFAELYLGDAAVCQAIAEWDRARCLPEDCEPFGMTKKERQARRREQTRLAVSRYRERQKTSETRSERTRARARERRLEKSREMRALAIDGEGMTLPSGDHVYRYLAACDSDGRVIAELEDELGIETRAALDFIARLPKYDEHGVKYLGVFGYGLGYDQTKWLEDLPDKPIYELFHSEDLEPKAKLGPHSLVLLGKCLQLTNKRGAPGSKRTLVWDILKGFQSTFVAALRSWKVGTKEVWDRIEAMKKQRGNFVRSDWAQVRAYCQDECKHLAELTETYVRAHIDAGIDLRGKYHGAGSTGDAFLSLMNAAEKRCTREVDDEHVTAFTETRSAFSRAFVGGRAEVDRLGFVEGPTHDGDVASAYPHALFLMPCVKHGKWKRVGSKGVGRAAGSTPFCCVEFELPIEPDECEMGLPKAKEIGERAVMMGITGSGRSTLPWGPLPYRTEKGSIVFPAAHPGGWAWAPEYRVAKRVFPRLKARGAWALKNGGCKCGRPYEAIGHYYLLRLEWGSDSRGKVLKLGLNSCYGKTAQVIGNNPKYACRATAGYITASTRGRLLEAIYSTKDPWNVFYVATDGIKSTEPLRPPNPPENETSASAKERGKMWLGQWELSKPNLDRLFVVQPGFWFSMRLPTEDSPSPAKTRGVPLEIIDPRRAEIAAQWEREPLEPPRGLPDRSVFRGIKQSILRPTKDEPQYRRKPSYGRWETEPRVIKYVIHPKRSDVLRLGDGLFRLSTWWLDPRLPLSHEYKKDQSFAAVNAENDDQPDFVEPYSDPVGD